MILTFHVTHSLSSQADAQSYYNSVQSHLVWNICILKHYIHFKIDSTNQVYKVLGRISFSP